MVLPAPSHMPKITSSKGEMVLENGVEPPGKVSHAELDCWRMICSGPNRRAMS